MWPSPSQQNSGMLQILAAQHCSHKQACSSFCLWLCAVLLAPGQCHWTPLYATVLAPSLSIMY